MGAKAYAFAFTFIDLRDCQDFVNKYYLLTLGFLRLGFCKDAKNPRVNKWYFSHTFWQMRRSMKVSVNAHVLRPRGFRPRALMQASWPRAVCLEHVSDEERLRMIWEVRYQTDRGVSAKRRRRKHVVPNRCIGPSAPSRKRQRVSPACKRQRVSVSA